VIRSYYRLVYALRARRIASRDAALEAAWQHVKPANATRGDRADFMYRMRAGR
jgi:hypothetical protein